MSNPDLLSRLHFIREIDKLKSIDRRTSLLNQSRLENTAEHSWHLATAVMVLAPFAKESLVLEDALKLALLHDVVEIDAGDTFVYDTRGLESKAQREHEAASRIFGILPGADAETFKDLWLRFEKQDCPESRFVAAIDRFLPLYANLYTDGFSWRKHQVKKSQVIERNIRIKDTVPELWALTLKGLDQAIAQGFLIDE